MRIRLMLCAILCVCTSVITCTLAIAEHPEPELIPAEPPSYQAPDSATLIKAKVVRIFDADTILVEIDGVKYRYQLLASNAPEFVPGEQGAISFSFHARRFMQQLLLDESVYLQHDPDGIRDAFGRRAAYVFRAPDMLFINLELIRQAYAQYDPRGVSLYAQSFDYYQAVAKSRSRGVWNPDSGSLDWSDSTDMLTADPDPILTQTDVQSPPLTTEPDKPVAESSVIYITKSGKKYHSKDCSHLSNSNTQSTREAVRETHQPCKSCKPDG